MGMIMFIIFMIVQIVIFHLGFLYGRSRAVKAFDEYYRDES